MKRSNRFMITLVLLSAVLLARGGDVATAQDEGLQQANQFQDVFRNVAEEVLPVVVEVNVVDVVEMRQSPFEFFFGPDQEDPRDRGEEPREFERQGLGSGVIVRQESGKAYVLTNAHVVSDVEEVSVVLSDEREFDAEIVGTDERLDLALLEIPTDEEVPVAEFGDSDALQVGDWVMAIGNPMGFESTVTTGIVSALGRSAPQSGQAVANMAQFIQTDAAINPGNSGGALVNLDGEVVGINTWIASRSGGNVGIGFAIPSNAVERAVGDLIEHGTVEYGWLGVSIMEANPEAFPNVRDDLGLDEETGALVTNVYSESPADEHGVMPGDFILSANGEDVEDSGELTRITGNLSPGQSLELELIRYGRRETVGVEIAQRSPEEELQDQVSRVWPGMIVTNVTEDIAERFDLPETDGVLIRNLVEGSPAGQSGFRQGDLIVTVNDEDVDDMRSFYRALNEYGDGGNRVEVLREGRTIERRLTQ
ncbi:MAG: trypsin-like peptidase domain-containing protein [Spirochaetaceae bacterium]